MPETPEDLAERLRAGSYHLAMALRVIREGDLAADDLPGYRDRMAVSAAVSAGVSELGQVWPWVTEQSHVFRQAVARAQLLRAEAWSDRALDPDEAASAVRAVELVLAGVDAALEGLARG